MMAYPIKTPADESIMNHTFSILFDYIYGRKHGR